MKSKSLLKLLTGSMIILIFALGLNAILSVSSFEKIYTDILTNKYKLIGSELKRKVETAVNLEKPLNNFYGMNEILIDIKSRESQLSNIMITQPSGIILYSTNKNYIHKKLDLSLNDSFPITPDITKNEENSFNIVIVNNNYYIALPIYYKVKKLVGIVYLEFNRNIIENQINSIINETIQYIIISLIIGIVLLTLLLFIVQSNIFREKIKLKDKTKNFLVIVFSLIISQSVFTYNNNNFFKDRYVNVINENVTTLTFLVQESIEEILQKGIPIDRLRKAEVLLRDIVRNMKECKEIKIVNKEGFLQYKADRNKLESIYYKDFEQTKVDLSTSEYTHKFSLSGISEIEGYGLLELDKKIIEERINELLLDALTIIMVSLIFSFEILLFFFLFIKKDENETELNSLEKVDPVINKDKYKLIRSLAFGFYFADAIPLSFLPLLIKEIYEKNPTSIFGLSKDMMLGLPISTYMLGVALFLPIAGYLLEKISIKTIFLISLSFTILSFILTAFSSSILQLIIFRFLSGMGYGGMVISGQTYVVRNTTSKNRTIGFGDLMSGFYGGIICASAIGGVMVSRLGYQATLISGAIITLLYFVFILIRFKKEAVPNTIKEKRGLAPIGNIFKVMKNRSFIGALFFESIPAQITFIGFIFYICPLYLNFIGTSQANIGRVLTGFGLAVIFVGPLVSQLADKLKNDRLFMIIGNILIGITLMSFFFVDGFYMIVAGIIAIGLGSALLASTEASYVSLVKEADELGASNVMSVFRTLERIGQIAGPLVAGILISMFQFSKSIAIIGTINIVAILIFILMSRNLRTSEIIENLEEEL